MPWRRPEEQDRRGRHLDELLVASLEGAVALEEVGDLARAVAEHLDFDVARTADEPLDVDVAVPKRGHRLGLAAGVGGVEVFEALDGADAAAPASSDSFYHHRGAFAQRKEEGFDVVQGRGGRNAGNDGHAGVDREFAGASLVAEELERFRAPDRRT